MNVVWFPNQAVTGSVPTQLGVSGCRWIFALRLCNIILYMIFKSLYESSSLLANAYGSNTQEDVIVYHLVGCYFIYLSATMLDYASEG